MKVSYRNKGLEKVCTNANIARKTYGEEIARKIKQRIGEIKASPNAQNMIQSKIGRCHPLKGNRAGQFAVDLAGPYRLVFREERGVIVIAQIEEIVDYHN